jgi:DNA mismatch endonuclease (patch repair protein)
MLIAATQRVYDGPIRTQVVWLPGTPDLALPDAKVVLCAMGCFWHGHEAEHCSISHVPPIGPTGFDWAKKFTSTRDRDARNRADLLSRGYRVAWCWECSLVGAGALSKADLHARLAAFIRGGDAFLEIEGRAVGKPATAA